MKAPPELPPAGSPDLEPLTPEAGERRYFRPRSGGLRGWLVVRTSTPAPVTSSAWLEGCGIRVPRLRPAAGGGYLVEDLGDRHLAHDPTPERYLQVLAARRRLAARPLPVGHPCRNRALDQALFRRELELFAELQLGRRGRLNGPAARRAAERACARLAREAAALPWSTQHRDLHSRNVLLPPDGGVALIDHQDLRPGPFLYDLASLRTDAYLDLPPTVAALIESEALLAGEEAGLTPAETRLRWHRTCLQRVLKALGTFARLLAAGRRDYAAAEARALVHARRLLAADEAYPEFREWLG
ncbi:MAG: hypothetical protein D6702_10995 [Planctomycetota bacterium]|nr:MAG: hypothetical protein D6702_10995 [Planctomycetota bacterium]